MDIQFLKRKPTKKQKYFVKKGIGVGSRFLRNVATQRRRQLITARDIQRPVIGSGLSAGKGRGRPKGAYDARYAAYGGVYGFRKVMAAQLAQQRLQAMRQATISPQQQAILSQVEAQQRARQVNPENQTIPTTTGQVRLKNIHDEIEAASHLFD
jgi:hypothetical protein